LETVSADFRCFYCSTNDHDADVCPLPDSEKRRIIHGVMDRIEATIGLAPIPAPVSGGITMITGGPPRGGMSAAAMLAEGVFLRKKRG